MPQGTIFINNLLNHMSRRNLKKIKDNKRMSSMSGTNLKLVCLKSSFLPEQASEQEGMNVVTPLLSSQVL